MQVSDAVTKSLETARQQSLDARIAREASYPSNGSTRNVGGTMGKNDFLMLLAMQLRYQNPLEPVSESDFASQLAQFSSLEQMQNMSVSLAAMANYQAYSLVGKYVVATATIDGVKSEISGYVDCIFTDNGVTYAQVGDSVIPLAAITDVIDSGGFTTPDKLMQTSSHLIGRTVRAQVKLGDPIIEGVVTRVKVDKNVMYAYIDDGSGIEKLVPVAGIYDIAATKEADKVQEPAAVTPPNDINGDDDDDDENVVKVEEDEEETLTT